MQSSRLPIYQSAIKEFMLHQTRWASILGPLIANPVQDGIILKKVPLIIGANVINHLLSRKQQGWIIADVDGLATIYRSMPFNDKTLTLVSSNVVNVDLYVF